MKEQDTLRVVGSPSNISIPVGDIAKTDLCFGRYNKNATECRGCTAPVVMNGKLVLFKEVCAAWSKGGDVAALFCNLNRIGSTEVRTRLESGRSLEAIWREILADNDPEVYGEDARNLLKQRLDYLATTYKMVLPPLPTTSELIECSQHPRKLN